MVAERRTRPIDEYGAVPDRAPVLQPQVAVDEIVAAQFHLGLRSREGLAVTIQPRRIEHTAFDD
jgi:hypothetical protein